MIHQTDLIRERKTKVFTNFKTDHVEEGNGEVRLYLKCFAVGLFIYVLGFYTGWWVR